jgi:hypothetical protein
MAVDTPVIDFAQLSTWHPRPSLIRSAAKLARFAGSSATLPEDGATIAVGGDAVEGGCAHEGKP